MVITNMLQLFRVLTIVTILKKFPTAVITNMVVIWLKIHQRLTVLRVFYKSKPQKVEYFKGVLEVKTTKKCFAYLVTETFPLTSVQVILVRCCSLFCVLSNDILKVSKGTFS